MSIDLNWETLTSGPDGDALAESIRTFIHSKFQTVQLPRFIRSVNVHGFDFGTIPPELELKDITDPLPDFYEQDDDEDEDGESEEDEQSIAERERLAAAAAIMEARKRENGLREALKNEMIGHDLGRAFLGTSTPGILGGPGRNYFQTHLGTGTHTPLAAVAGAHLGTSWMGSTVGSEAQTPHHSREASLSSIDNFQASLDPGPVPSMGAKSDVSSTLGPPSRPSTSHGPISGSAIVDDEDERAPEQGTTSPRREPKVEDVQAVFRIRYSGDVRLNLTAEILLDYPMPSFVGIPLKLNITGLTFDGVGVLAHIRKRVHFCFLNPDDALAAVGPEADESTASAAAATGGNGGDLQGAGKKPPGGRFGGLLQEIKVESEIGERESGRQSLKNVGKVEKFVLEQVRRIFEEEFVYPSFWTFLV
ncbi:phosphatidylinositol 4-phosphate 5-kinase [Trichoderma arundinaceum]|uniref:Mitochondrial distribution and morphology protein 12 n=1 Tax=Trichoderma arundinaceum TaxID=490622 RepID=A0A395NZV5_TRIAR|nr:phosphatidylinositol 4-phosphate 5-kinase [Trichoderma arundinaceum]